MNIRSIVLALALLLWGSEPDETQSVAVGMTPADEASRPLRLTFLGDIMAHRPNWEMDDYDRIYHGVRSWLSADDLTFANLETPIHAGRPYSTWPRFNVHIEYARAAIDGGIEVFSLANNHSTDWYAEGAMSTLALFRRLADDPAYAGRIIRFAGLRHEPGEWLQVQTIWLEGWRIGYMAVTQFLNDPHNGADLVQRIDWRAPAEGNRLVEWIEEVSPSYDLFIVSYHAGIEYRLEPEAGKVRFFRRLIKAGADIVWGHHPHVLQPWRRIERPDGRHALILYSMGNFVSGQTWFIDPEDADDLRAFTGDSALLRVVVRRLPDGADVSTVAPLLISHYKHPDGGVVVRPLDSLIESDEVPTEWQDYYRRRREMVRAVIQ